MECPFLYTIEEIFGNKANSTIRMYAIKVVSNFFHLIFHFIAKICFHLLILNCFVSIHFFVTSEKKLLIHLKDAFVRFILFRDAMAPVPGKPISANRGLNIANRRINFIPRLDSVPESTINLNLGIN